MYSEKLRYRLALTLIPKIGAITARKLIDYVGSPEGVFTEKAATLRAIPGIGEYLAGQVSKRNYIEEADREIEKMIKSKISYLYYEDENYPWRLKNCIDGPLLLYYRGQPDFARTRFLSIVGTRNASQYGREMCELIISELASGFPDLVIVSGLAYGIDIMAHRFALRYGLHTYAVLAHGLNTIYPPSHADSATRILKQGALLTDFLSDTRPEKNNFLRRNRIIAGLSEATLVVESGMKGGALITAELAASYNREVFAVPGRAIDTYSAGCNRLIQNNIAALVESGSDIEKQLGWESTTRYEEAKKTINTLLTEKEKLIIRAITEEPELGQEIISIRTGIPLHTLAGHLLQMELRGLVTQLPGNLYRTAVKLEAGAVS
jgi:DNA processing protein